MLWLAGAGLALFGQSVSAGVKGGVRTSGDFEYAATSESRRYVVGPTVEVRLPLRFAVGFDALYRRQGYSAGNGTPLYTRFVREADNVWEFPLLARYRIPFRGIRPFAETGWAPRIMSGSANARGSYLSQINPTTYSYYSERTHADWPTTHGVVAGGGMEFAAGCLQIAPEVRYIHWNRRAVYGYFADGPSYGSSQNQLDFMLGMSWRLRK